MPTTLATRPPINSAQIHKAATSLGMLGAGADSAPRILSALCNPDLRTDELVSLVERQPALYARVLRVANSAYYGQARSITNIDRALVLLGLDSVRGIVAAACLDRVGPRKGEDGPVDMQALVQHSLATATAAESLAQIHSPALAPDAFIAGLLHNLGIIIQIHLDSAGVEAMVRARRSDATRDMRALEAEQAAVSHETCVATLFESWQLPELLIAATRHHHAPMNASEAHRDFAALINLGANLGLAGGSTFTLEPAPVVRDSAAMAWLGFGDAQLDRIVVDLPARVQAYQRALFHG